MTLTILRIATGSVVACLLAVGCGSSGSGNTGTGGRDAAADSKLRSNDGAAPSSDAGGDATTGMHDARADVGSTDATASRDSQSLADVVAHDVTHASDAPADHAASSDAGRDAVSDAHAATDGGGADAPSSEDAGLPSTFLNRCDGGHTTVTGTELAPNGTDPIPNVRVYAASAINGYPANYCDKCSAPLDPAYTSTVSGPDGTFSLDLDDVPASANITFAIQIGRFRKHTTIPVTACQSVSVPTAAMTLPGTHSAGDIPSIVVSSGNADHLDVVLTDLGILDYDCYEGRSAPAASTPTCAQVAGLNIADVISSAATLDGYNMAFLSCAPGAYAEFITTHNQATMNTNTQNWVAAGGRIFVTDTAYDYIAQPFPSYVTWAGTGGSPQPVDTALNGCAPAGPGGESAHAVQYPTNIDDATLTAWLKVVGFSSAPSVQIQGYYQPWAAIASLSPGANMIANGTMPIDPTGPTTCSSNTANLPLTTEFDVPTCGRAVFSSFHTYTGTGASAATANLKIMEYLIFAAATCSG